MPTLSHVIYIYVVDVLKNALNNCGAKSCYGVTNIILLGMCASWMNRVCLQLPAYEIETKK